MLILIAEDDANLRRGLAELLQLENFETISAACGLSALDLFENQHPDFCILDVNMPGLDGFEVCKRIRMQRHDVPVLFLTARTDEIDRVLGFGHGADDYMGKPFSAQELIARIKAIARRAGMGATHAQSQSHAHSEGTIVPDEFLMRDLLIDSKALRAHRGKAVIDLSQRELSVLKYFHAHAGQIVSRDALYDACWGRSHFANSRALDQFISTMRRKIERDAGLPRIITTVHGAGYRYDP